MGFFLINFPEIDLILLVVLCVAPRIGRHI